MVVSPVMHDEHGFVRGFSYHDGFLDAVLVAGAYVHFGLRSTDGDRRVLTLRNVAKLHIESFREANIVLNLRVVPVTIAAADSELKTLLRERLFIDPTKISTALQAFVLDGTYGADVIALCEGVEISEAGETVARKVVR